MNGLTAFFNHVDSRIIEKDHKPVFAEANWVLRRCRFDEELKAYILHVVLWAKRPLPHLRGRRYSGTSQWGLDVPADVTEHLSHELALLVPRSQSGRSAFALGSLLKTACRYVSPRAVGSLFPVDYDMKLAHIQLRTKRVAAFVGEFPLHVRVCAELDREDVLDDVIGGITALLTFVKTSPTTAKDTKRLLVALANGCGGLQAWASSNFAVLSAEKVQASRTVYATQWDMLRQWQHESEAMHVLNSAAHAELVAYLKAEDGNGSGGFNHARVTCALDHHDERVAIDAVETVAPLLRGRLLCSAEHDGVVTWWRSDLEKFEFLERASAMSGLVFAEKTYLPPVDVAKEKYRSFVFSEVASCPTLEFFDHYQVALRTLGNSGDANAKSMHFSAVIASTLQGQVYKMAKDDEFEVWDHKASVWRQVKAGGLFSLVQAELIRIFCPKPPRAAGRNPVVYPVPLSTESFVGTRCQYVAKLAEFAAAKPLDHDYRFKLLFPRDIKDPDSVSMLYNFKTGILRPVQAADRLRLHAKRPFRAFEPSAPAAALFNEFISELLVFTKENSGLVDDDESAQACSLRRLFVSLMELKEDFPFFTGAARQWVKILPATETAAAELHGSLDLFLYVMKHIPRAFARSNLHTGMLSLTGATGSGKGTFLYCMQNFGGEGPENLVHSLGSRYLHERVVRASEECRPVLAGARCKAVLYCDDYPDDEVNPDTIKPLVENRGGRVCARFGGAREDQGTAVEVSWGLVVGTGNYKLRIPRGAAGIVEKIPEVTPPFRFVNVGEANQPGLVESDPKFALAIEQGRHDPEYFWLMQAFAPLVFDERLVKGRMFGPLPASVRARMDGLSDGGGGRHLGCLSG